MQPLKTPGTRTAFCARNWGVLLWLLLLPAAGQAQFTYIADNGTVTITGYSGPGGEVTVPGTLGGLPVTSIGQDAFQDCTNLTGVTLPNSLTQIGTEAFWDCASLRSVILPNNVITLGTRAFGHCYSLASLTLPNSLTSIGDYAFQRCTNLTSVTLPGSLTNLGECAFYRCTGLTHVTLPASVCSLGQAPFAFCLNLLTVTVDALNPFYCSVDGVLYNKSLTQVVQYPCGRRGHYTVADGVTSIGTLAFAYCFNLTSVTVPASVTNVETLAFEYSADSTTPVCSNLTVVWFQGSAPATGASAFDGVPYLMVYYCAGTSGWGASFGGRPTALWEPNVPYAYLVNNGAIVLQRYIGSGGAVTIPDSLNGLPVTSIADGAFSGYDSLTRVIVGRNITYLGNGAFADCASLTGVYFPGNAPSLGASAFDNDHATVYYQAGTTGWGTTLGGRPTALWLPQVQTADGSFGVRTNRFGFTVTTPGNLSVVVDACTNLAHPTWVSLQTNSTTSGSFYFSDPGWRIYPLRTYRLRWR